MKKLSKTRRSEIVNYIKNNRSRMLINDIAKKLNVSRSTVKRIGKEHGLSFSKYQSTFYTKQQKKTVISYYLKVKSLKKTQERFPDVKVRSIIEIVDYKNFVNQWGNEDLIEMVRLSYLTNKQIAKKHNTSKGSIDHVLKRRIGKISRRNYFGLCNDLGKKLCKDSINNEAHKQVGFVKMFSWEQIKEHLDQEFLPDYIVKAITELAKFNKWVNKCTQQ